MIEIDGSMGEGGGQIVRTALGLSLATQYPFRITNVRASRARPGLRPQHVTAVEAAATIGQAEVTTVEVGTSAFSFQPAMVEPGRYQFDVGTAGSAVLVLHLQPGFSLSGTGAGKFVKPRQFAEHGLDELVGHVVKRNVGIVHKRGGPAPRVVH